MSAVVNSTDDHASHIYDESLFLPAYFKQHSHNGSTSDERRGSRSWRGIKKTGWKSQKSSNYCSMLNGFAISSQFNTYGQLGVKLRVKSQ